MQTVRRRGRRPSWREGKLRKGYLLAGPTRTGQGSGWRRGRLGGLCIDPMDGQEVLYHPPRPIRDVRLNRTVERPYRVTSWERRRSALNLQPLPVGEAQRAAQEWDRAMAMERRLAREAHPQPSQAQRDRFWRRVHEDERRRREEEAERRREEEEAERRRKEEAER